MSEKKTLDLTPTWTAVLPLLLEALEKGTEEGKDIARDELKNMAKAADQWNDHVRNAKQPKVTPTKA